MTHLCGPMQTVAGWRLTALWSLKVSAFCVILNFHRSHPWCWIWPSHGDGQLIHSFPWTFLLLLLSFHLLSTPFLSSPLLPTSLCCRYYENLISSNKCILGVWDTYTDSIMLSRVLWWLLMVLYDIEPLNMPCLCTGISIHITGCTVNTCASRHYRTAVV